MNVYRLESVRSTNSTAREGNYRAGDVIVAREQTGGRGQRGHVWESEPGKNLMLSAVFEPTFLDIGRQFLLSECVALAVTDLLTGYGIEARIKWTNDIYVGDRKLCGILLEHDLRGDRIVRTVAGIGLDVNQRVFSAWIPNPTSMSLVTGEVYDTDRVLERLLVALERRYAMLREDGEQIVEADYRALMYRRGREHWFSRPDGELFRGTIRGVRPSGELLIEEDGVLHAYLHGEVGFVIDC